MALSFQSGLSMDVERFTQAQYVSMEATHVKIKVLLVDDDSTILTIASTLLRAFKYEVTAVKSPADALSSLRMRRGAYDLLVTDYHMPGMNGLELQKVVLSEYKLPVIVMSADERECIIMKTLECGAAFFIVKPIKAEDVKNIWQYAVASRKGKSDMSLCTAGVVNVGFKPTAKEVEAMGIAGLGELMDMESRGEAIEVEEVDSLASLTEIKETRAKRAAAKRKHKKEKDINGGESSQSYNPKRSKVVWTTTLHNLFLQALNQIGLEKAVPKKILEYMGVPGLTRENVASHLQKYRIFLRRVADKTYTRSTSLEKTTKSSFAATHLSLINGSQEDGSGYPKLPHSTLPADFCKNLSSSSPGILLGSSSSGINAFPFPSRSLDVAEKGIGFLANRSGLQMISHRVDSMETAIPLEARLPIGNAVTVTMNSLATTNQSYLQQSQSREWPLVPLGGIGTIRSTDQGVENQNTGREFTAEDSILPIGNDDLMNSSERFMDILTQGDPSTGVNGSNHLTQGFSPLLKNDSAAVIPASDSTPNAENKEDPLYPMEMMSAVPNIWPQRHVGDNDLFNVLFEHMHRNDHGWSDSRGDSMGIFSSCYDSPFGGSPGLNQEQGNENQRSANSMGPCLLQSQATQDQVTPSRPSSVAQQPAAPDIPTTSLLKQQDIWADHPSAEDQMWAEDFIDSLLDSSIPCLL